MTSFLKWLVPPPILYWRTSALLDRAYFYGAGR